MIKEVVAGIAPRVARFAPPIVGIPMRMDKLTRLRHAQQGMVRVQRRVWLAQVLMWPTVIAAGVSSVGGLVGSCGAGTPVVGMKCRIHRERTRWAPCKSSPTAGSPTSESGLMALASSTRSGADKRR